MPEASKVQKKGGVSLTTALFGLLLAGSIGYLIGTSPSGVSPPVAVDQPAPPWPLLRVAVGLSDFLLDTGKAMLPPDIQVFNKATAFFESAVIYTFCKLRIQDELAAGPKTCSALASGIQANEDMTCRILRAGQKIGLVQPTADGKWQNTAMAQLLVGDDPSSMRHFVQMINEESLLAWYSLPEAIKTGKSGFLTKYGDEFWSWHTKNAPGQMEQFNKAMSGITSSSSMAIIQDYDFKDAKVVCDIGGGNGLNLALILKHYPGTKGMVLDMPSVVVDTVKVFEDLQISDRTEAVGGSFFEPLPASFKVCDTFILKIILHDWGDADSIKILKNIADSMDSGERILIGDCAIDTAGSSMETGKVLMDINMMSVNTLGARERTVEEFSSLLQAAGLKFGRHVPLRGTLISVIEGFKA